MKKVQNKISYLFASLITLTLLVSCQEVVTYDLDESNKILVIDGMVTDQPGPYTVKLSLTGPYLKNAPTNRATGATVIIRDNAGNTDTLAEQLPGEYKTTASFSKGEIGRTYQLYVNYENKVYTASGEILPISNVDSLTYKYHEESILYPENGYYVTMYAQEPAGKGNNYRFKFIVNGFFSNRADRFIVVNDDFVDGNYISFTTPFPVALGDSVVLESQSFTKAAYDYYFALLFQMNPNGFFDAPPANLPTNITGGALGYFNTVAIKYNGIKIK